MTNEERIALIETEFGGEDGWSDWIHPLPGYLLQCCDCGLVHEMEFQIGDRADNTAELNPGESNETGVVIYRARRFPVDGVQS